MVGLRQARPEDAAEIRAIYAPFVIETAVSFEYTVPPVDRFVSDIERTVKTYSFLVAEEAGHVVGFAKGTGFRTRDAYAWSAEVSVYVAAGFRGQGVGRRLVMGVLDELKERGYVTAIAGVTLPNVASVALFESLGFTPCGTFEKVGYKFEAWHDVGFWQRALRGYPTHPRAVAAGTTSPPPPPGADSGGPG
ncbi:MAG TPA: GNAT family N-acetyltransferase [Actinomycetota bacterium]|nr:GNAT family N-acetyltransferase [Actinomycetota bacterium]